MAIDNPRFPHTCVITRPTSSDPNEDEEEGSVIYEGECRSFTSYTTSDKGVVITSTRKLALPLKQDEWTDETIPHAGDAIVVQKTGFTEYGKVIDVLPGNLGTHILWEYGRN